MAGCIGAPKEKLQDWSARGKRALAAKREKRAKIRRALELQVGVDVFEQIANSGALMQRCLDLAEKNEDGRAMHAIICDAADRIRGRPTQTLAIAARVEYRFSIEELERARAVARELALAAGPAPALPPADGAPVAPQPSDNTGVSVAAPPERIMLPGDQGQK